MTYLKILNHSQKKEFESPPQISDEARSELFALPQSMGLQLDSIDKDVNKLHFIVMYGYFKLFRAFYGMSSYHQNDIDYISKSLILLLIRSIPGIPSNILA